MKHALFLLACLCFSVLSYAQSNTSAPGWNILAVSLSKNTMVVKYKNQLVPVRTIEALDSLMKKISGSEHLKVEFDCLNADPEKSRLISKVMEQCHCPYAARSFKTFD